MGTVPSSTGATGSDGPGPTLACVLHPSRRVVADSTIPLSFKTRARNQILRLHRELLDERERHERVVKELREQNKEDVVSLSSRVEFFEAQWSRLQRRMTELWLEVEGLKLAKHTYPNSNASAQMAPSSVIDNSTQTQEISSSNATTQTDEDTRSNLKLWLAAGTENELKRWRTAFSDQSGTPEQVALRSKLIDKELRDWRTAFEHTPGTPAQAAVKSKTAIEELKEWHTSFNHVSGTPAQSEEASKTFQRRFSCEEAKNRKLSIELGREMSKREKLLRAFKEYQGTSNPRNETRKLTSPTGPGSLRRGPESNSRPQSPNSGHLPKRKREDSEPGRQQDEPLPAPQRRRVEYSDPERNQGGRQSTSVAQSATPQNVPPAGAPRGPSRESVSNISTVPRSMSVQCSTNDPIGPSGVLEGTRRNSVNIGTFAPRHDSYRPSSDSYRDSYRPSKASANESMLKPPGPLEKRWKHSVLKKEH